MVTITGLTSDGSALLLFVSQECPTSAMALRKLGISGHRVVLLDIRKNRGAEFLDRIDTLLQGAGTTTARSAKEIFSKPASLVLIDEIADQADLVVEALAD